MATLTNPDYLIDGIIQRGRVHALTSMTGHGETAAALFFGCSIATARNIGNIEVVQGDVVFLAGEDPDDLCGRFHAACQFYGIDPAKLPIRVMPGNFPLATETAETLKQTIDGGGRETSREKELAPKFITLLGAFSRRFEQPPDIGSGALYVLTYCYVMVLSTDRERSVAAGNTRVTPERVCRPF